MFGQERAINLVVGFLTALIVFVTLVSAFVFHEYSPRGVNIFFGVIIVLICASHLTVVSRLCARQVPVTLAGHGQVPISYPAHFWRRERGGGLYSSTHILVFVWEMTAIGW